MNRPELVAWVDEKLRANWSPEQIAGRIRLEYTEDQSMRISTETIYRWVYAATHWMLFLGLRLQGDIQVFPFHSVPI